MKIKQNDSYVQIKTKLDFVGITGETAEILSKQSGNWA
jgi:hypothetical protein